MDFGGLDPGELKTVVARSTGGGDQVQVLRNRRASRWTATSGGISGVTATAPPRLASGLPGQMYAQPAASPSGTFRYTVYAGPMEYDRCTGSAIASTMSTLMLAWFRTIIRQSPRASAGSGLVHEHCTWLRFVLVIFGSWCGYTLAAEPEGHAPT